MIQHDLQRKIDALGLALGLCRGVMIDVMNDDHDIDEVKRILLATSLTNIAQAINEEKIDLSWSETLSCIEHQLVAGVVEERE